VDETPLQQNHQPADCFGEKESEKGSEKGSVDSESDKEKELREEKRKSESEKVRDKEKEGDSEKDKVRGTEIEKGKEGESETVRGRGKERESARESEEKERVQGREGEREKERCSVTSADSGLSPSATAFFPSPVREPPLTSPLCPTPTPLAVSFSLSPQTSSLSPCGLSLPSSSPPSPLPSSLPDNTEAFFSPNSTPLPNTPVSFVDPALEGFQTDELSLDQHLIDNLGFDAETIMSASTSNLGITFRSKGKGDPPALAATVGPSAVKGYVLPRL
jgi:hypothetical protein